MALGILLGLLTGLGHSLAYLASRWFTVDRGRPVSQLLVQGHVLMGAVCWVALPFLWPVGFAPTAEWWGQLSGLIGFFVLAQVCLLSSLRATDASRVAPLLGMKVAVLALLSVLMGMPLTGTQWTGVAMAVAAAWVLNDVGGRLAWKVTALVVGACLAYALADTFIKGTIEIAKDMTGDHSRFGIPIFTVAAVYGSLGVIALPLLGVWGSRKREAWRDTLPYAAIWLATMVALYATFASLGTVLGAILQSTRGLISILLGVMLAGMGWHHLEQKHGWAVQARRLGAAALMCLAVLLYVWGGR
ncbi:EamA family transporter [Algisphaera agarilytica]|uniref:Drug/metabolite transporter (DMT)-like permease n=1 Tax=Algisphaera agarilytica TaxID=1385975 RepID=A0A7X0H5S3_9BACT|nr:EamA family transporter [Algisphaera agarilytica]MBB6429818.1 drug/metabolite transporter (DMT)-like permease [Algisphaera agarilytica]